MSAVVGYSVVTLPPVFFKLAFRNPKFLQLERQILNLHSTGKKQKKRSPYLNIGSVCESQQLAIGVKRNVGNVGYGWIDLSTASLVITLPSSCY